MFYPYEGHRSVTPLDAARVNRKYILVYIYEVYINIQISTKYWMHTPATVLMFVRHDNDN